MAAEIAENKAVIFSVGQEEYAVPISSVKEVVPWTKPRPVPEAQSIVEGVVDLRGDIFPVIDLGKRFGTGRSREPADSRIMVIDVEGRQVGFVVDEVTEVCTYTSDQVKPPSPLLRRGHSDPMVSGILKVGENRLVVLVEVAKVLTEELHGF